MAQRHMERGSTSLVMRDMYITPTMRCHFTPGRMASFKKNRSDTLARRRRKEEPCVLSVRLSVGAASVESSTEDSHKAKTRTPYDPAIPLLGIYPIIIMLKDTHTAIVAFIVHSIIYN